MNFSNFQEFIKYNPTQIFSLPLDQSYFVCTFLDNQDKLDTWADKHFDSTEKIYIFPNKKMLKEYLEPISHHLHLFLDILTPGEIIFKVKIRNLEKQEVFIYLPKQEVIEKLNLEKPLVAILPKTSENLFYTNLLEIETNFNDLAVLNTKNNLEGLNLSIVDITEKNHLEILSPGIIDYQEIIKIIPKSISITENFQINLLTKIKKFQPIYEIFHTKDDTNLNLIAGSKEQLQKLYPNLFFNYFKYKQVENTILFNLGSETNTENIARNLHSNLREINNFGIIQNYIIKSETHNPKKWSKIITFLLAQTQNLEYVEMETAKLKTKLA
jgi:hypothetical protein